jgi:hypothetical protein
MIFVSFPAYVTIPIIYGVACNDAPLNKILSLDKEICSLLSIIALISSVILDSAYFFIFSSPNFVFDWTKLGDEKIKKYAESNMTEDIRAIIDNSEHISLSNDNILLRGASLQATPYIIGIVT